VAASLSKNTHPLREGIITLQDGHLFIYNISNAIQVKEMGALRNWGGACGYYWTDVRYDTI
jgi:hypothetical protein